MDRWGQACLVHPRLRSRGGEGAGAAIQLLRSDVLIILTGHNLNAHLSVPSLGMEAQVCEKVCVLVLLIVVQLLLEVFLVEVVRRLRLHLLLSEAPSMLRSYSDPSPHLAKVNFVLRGLLDYELLLVLILSFRNNQVL